MTNDEKQLFKDLFKRFKGLYYRQKLNDDIIERLLNGKSIEQINEARIRFEESDEKITELELKELEERINRL